VGRLGWDIQTIKGHSPAERLDQGIFWTLSLMGTLLLVVDFFMNQRVRNEAAPRAPMNPASDTRERRPSQGARKLPLARWLLCGPAGVAAYLLIIVIVVLIQSLAGRGDERDRSIELAANAIAAFSSSVAVLAVAPAYRLKVGIVWVACVLLVACYGNLIDGFVNWSVTIQNFVAIGSGCIFGCVAARAWLNQGWQ
jgi:hypothetical protein